MRHAIGLNSKGNVFGSGFRANAAIGRSIRLTAVVVVAAAGNAGVSAVLETLGPAAVPRR